MNILFVGSFNSNNINIFRAHIELIIGISKKENVTKTVVTGKFSDEIQTYFKEKNIETIYAYPKSKFDKTYSNKIEQIIQTNKIEIVQFFSGSLSRSILRYVKKRDLKYVTYFGSVSLYWHDISSYFTYLNPKIDSIICNSNYVYNHVKKQLFGKNKQKAVMIYKGYDSLWFKDVTAFDYDKLSIPQESIKVCFVGNHRKVKGTKYFIESSYFLNSTEDIHYFVIGNNTDINEFKEIAKNSPITKKIHFLGLRTDAVSLVKGCDIYVQTSLSEGLGRAISEAMSVEKPIVMTNAGGCTELIDQSSGIVVPLKDSKSIGKAISKLANNKELRNEMGKNAKKRIDNQLNISINVDETLKLYQSLLNS
jgi:glycosyltransferase involved in cell wall biosynthesis